MDNLNVLNIQSKGDPRTEIHLSLMGHKLKIYKLFESTMEMWNLLGKIPTRPTSLFNINFLVSDQNEYVYLTNGMSVRVETLGASSFDLNNFGSIDYWNMNTKMNLKTK
jgi:hypothetical protein